MKQIVPDKTAMRRYLTRGLTQQQIVEAWEEDTGVRVSRSAIAMAIGRYDLKAANSRPRYEDTIPWKVKTEHQNDHNARMLRLEARRRRGQKLTEHEQRWLDDWKALLKERNAVVTYIPELPEGFVWMQRDDNDDDLVRREWRGTPKAAPPRARRPRQRAKAVG